jgi:hypothetical protein
MSLQTKALIAAGIVSFISGILLAEVSFRVVLGILLMILAYDLIIYSITGK